MRQPGKVSRWLGATAAALLVFAGAASAQEGTVVGVVRSGDGTPLAGAQITAVVAGDAAAVGAAARVGGTLTQQDGRYVLRQVPAGRRILITATIIGFAESTEEVTVAAGETATVNFTMTSEAIALEEIIVTGVSGATIKAKVPFEVASLGVSDLPVPQVSAGSTIQGKVAGATVVSGDGRPGTAPSILLRGATSIDASGRSQEPLYIVDGVILGSSMVDIDALDIEQIEVVKGAAASSLYGSRAANGVIQITTKRGGNVASGDVRYTVRTEYGQSDLPGEFLLSQSHEYLMTQDGTQFVQLDGTPCDFLECGTVQLAGQRAGAGESANQWNTFQTNRWPGQTFNQVDRFFRDGAFGQHYLAAAGRAGATNFHVSYSNLNNEGVLPGQEGFERNNFRLNLDQSINPRLHVAASAFYSRSDASDNTGSPFFDLTRMPAGVDLLACEDDPATPEDERQQSCADDPENIILLPDPTNAESSNPIYELLVRDFEETRGRFLGSGNVRFSLTEWLDLDANASYDRLDFEQSDLFPKGFRTVSPPFRTEGSLSRFVQLNEALNASATATMRFRLSESIDNRTQLRYLYEQQDREFTNVSGRNFAVADIPQLGNLDSETLSSSSGTFPVRSDGYYAITNFDILDRYIVDALIRNDGSSLFGEDERRQWYYRLAGAWRMGQEPWFTVPAVDEMKFRYSFGTAGSRPRFEAQYETFSISGGRVVPVNLGNTQLKPEFSREHEAGVDAALFAGRMVLGLTYADKETEDQILQVPLPAFTGFSSQWQNAGTLASKTWEATLEARLLQARDFSWSARVLYDRTRTEITELNVPPFTYGVPGQRLGNVFFARPGEELGTFYGVEFATTCGDLPTGVSCDGFATNDDGFLVWVGDGTLDNPNWGTSADVLVRGVAPMWGTPFAAECTDRTTGDRVTFCPVGRSTPDYNVALSNTITWKGLSLYGLLDAVQGFDVYNQPLQWATFKRKTALCDQAGLPEAEQKPLGYCDALYSTSGLGISSAFVEDGSFVKLREVSLAYRIGSDVLGHIPALNAFSGATLSAIGRNLFTWSDYRGYDPEVGSGGGDTGSAALARVDGFQYPNFRTWTLGVELNF